MCSRLSVRPSYIKRNVVIYEHREKVMMKSPRIAYGVEEEDMQTRSIA
jgi:hypothetical protein